MHPSNDVRIFHKECLSLAGAGYRVNFLVAGVNRESEIIQNVRIAGFKKLKSKPLHLLFSPFNAFVKAINTKSAIYHLHDPNLILCGILLKLFNKKVVYDIHENVYESILEKHWISKRMRRFLANLYLLFEKAGVRLFDFLILAEKSYKERFPRKSIVIQNFPKLDYLSEKADKNFSGQLNFIYTGIISFDRGLSEMLEIIRKLLNRGFDLKLFLYGYFYDEKTKKFFFEYLNKKQLAQNIFHKGFLDIKELYKIFPEMHIGFNLLKPIRNYRRSLATKVFDYMANGLPVINSDIVIYKSYIQNENAGMLINNNNINEAVDKIAFLIRRPDRLAGMSGNGRKASLLKYNWKNEEKKLLSLYHNLLKTL